jgi:hypothetical protein
MDWPSCETLATKYESGDGVKTDSVRLKSLLKQAAIGARKACDGRDKRACWALGKIFLLGRGVDVDLGKAIAAFERGCALGDGESCCCSSHIQAEGDDVAQDQAKAADLLMKCREIHPCGK